MATDRRYEVKMSVPDGAMPGTLLDVPVRAGSEKVRIRVPDGCGGGSVLVLSQAEGSSEWDLKVEEAKTPPQDSGAAHEVMRTEMARQEDSPPPVLSDQPVAYTVRLDTTVGVIDMIVRPDWAPHGTRRFLELATSGDLCNLAFYRAIKGCICQFGLPPKRPWPPIPDDPPTGVPFLLGAVSFAAIGPNSRKSTLFICTGDMSHCLGDKSWETPIGAVAEASLDVLEYIETVYGDIVEFGGQGPDTSRINSEGNIYLQTHFPKLTYIRSATVLDDCTDVQPGDAAQEDTIFAVRAAQDSEGLARTNASSAQQALQQAQEAAAADSLEELREAARRARQAADAAEASAKAAEATLAAAESKHGYSANRCSVTPQMQMAAPAVAAPQPQLVPLQVHAMVPSPCPGQPQRMLSNIAPAVGNPTVQALQLAHAPPHMQQLALRPLMLPHGQVMGPPFVAGCRPQAAGAPPPVQGAFPVMSNGGCGVPQTVPPAMLPQVRPCQPGPAMDLT